jgi:hypothetical protein
MFVMENAFQFNDPTLDKQQLESMKPGDHGLTFLNDENLNSMMNDAFANKKANYYDVTINSKTKGRWDFSSTYLLPALGIDPDKKVPLGDTKGGFILLGMKTTAYNINDAGNWLWGHAMRRVGISLGLAKGAAHGNSVLLDHAGLDSKSDQRAIGSGHIYEVQTTNAIMHRMFLADPVKKNANSPKQWGH